MGASDIFLRSGRSNPNDITLFPAGFLSGSNFSIFPNVAALSINGFGSALDLGTTPGTGTATISGASSSLGSGILTGIGALSISGAAAALSSGLFLTPGAGSLVFAGYQSVLTISGAGMTIQPLAGQLAILGAPPVAVQFLSGAASIWTNIWRAKGKNTTWNVNDY